jgi:polar amino acid transport system substrate-binding protein
MKMRQILFAGLCSALIATFAAPTASFAQAQNSVEAVKARGKLLAGIKFDTPPFGYLDNENKPTGFDHDLLTKVAEKIGVPVEFVSVTSQTRIPMLVSGNVDLVAASMTHTIERDRTIDFSITYYTGGQALLTKAGSDITGLASLAGKQVALQQGTTLEKNIAAAAPGAKLVGFKDYNSAWLALVQGRADALTGSLNILQGFAKENKNYQIVGDIFSSEPFGIGVRQGDWAMRDLVNETLQELWKSGEYQKLYVKRFGEEPRVPIEIWP